MTKQANVKIEMSFEKAIEMGEYRPEYLNNFSGWGNLSPHVQLQFIRKGIKKDLVPMLIILKLLMTLT